MNKTEYIIQELLERGLISEDNKGEITKVIDKGPSSKEYRLKERIKKAIEGNYLGIASEEDINAIYISILGKYKESYSLDKDELQGEVRRYIESSYKQVKPIDTINSKVDIYKIPKLPWETRSVFLSL